MRIPPLREIVSDLPKLVRHFTSKGSNYRFDTSKISFSADAMDVFTRYGWPGNMGELREIVTRLVSETEIPTIAKVDLPLHIRNIEEWPDLITHMVGQPLVLL